MKRRYLVNVWLRSAVAMLAVMPAVVVLQFVFVLMPAYRIAGMNVEDSVVQAERIGTLYTVSKVLNGVLMLLFIGFTLCLTIGLVRASKHSSHGKLSHKG